jgi:threonine dehydrogenase-like Zn-dependent dehydrogenase
MTRTARAAVLDAGGQFTVRAWPVPEIAADSGLLRLVACGICGTDVEQAAGKFQHYPVIPGHEPVGIIERIGDAAARKWGVDVGDLVAVEPMIACGACDTCRRGLKTCRKYGVTSYGFFPLEAPPHLLGGYAESMYLHPDSILHRFPRGTDPVMASFYNPLGAGFSWAQRAAGTQPGDCVVIQGAGQRGLMCLIAALEAGAGRVIVTDLAAARWKLDLATRLGAHHVVVADEADPVRAVHDLTGGAGADVVLDVSGTHEKPVANAIAMVRPGGTVVVAALKYRGLSDFRIDDLAFKAVTLRGVLSVDSDSYRPAMALIASGQYPLRDLHTHTLPLEQAARAIDLLAGREPGERAFHLAIAPG